MSSGGDHKSPEPAMIVQSPQPVVYQAPPLAQTPIAAHYSSIPSHIYGGQATDAPTASVAGTYEVIPHRIFVGGFPPGTEESDLRSLFEPHGQVREVKVIRNTENGVSKGYGFVTFETDEEARAIRTCNEKLEIDGRRLNLGPAMRRIHHNQRFSDTSSPAMGAMQPYTLQPQVHYVPMDVQQAVSAGYVFSTSPGQASQSTPYMVMVPGQGMQQHSTINNTTYAAYPQQPYINMTQPYQNQAPQYLMSAGAMSGMTCSSQQPQMMQQCAYGYASDVGGETNTPAQDHANQFGRNIRRTGHEYTETRKQWHTEVSANNYAAAPYKHSYYTPKAEEGGACRYTPSQQQQQTVGEVAKNLEALTMNSKR